MLLLTLAAEKLATPLEALRVADGTISSPSGKTITYWDLTEQNLWKTEILANVKPKRPNEYEVVGKSVRRIDIPAKVTGGEAFVHDMRLPGMLFGRVVRPPSYGATLVSVDADNIAKMPGVVNVVVNGSFLGIVAEREEQAIAGLWALKESAQWKEQADMPPTGSQLFSHLKKLPTITTVVSEKQATLPTTVGRKTVNATYTRPYQAHASIGPSCAVAHLDAGRLHVWSHTQGVFGLRTDLARVLGLDITNVVVSHKEGAGCYGHNGADDVALDAALLARYSGNRPVKVQWMRDDEFAWEPYGSAMTIQLRGTVDSSGNIVEWSHELWSHTHNMRPGEKDGTNLLGSWYLDLPFKPAPPRDIPAQFGGGGDRNAVPLYNFPNQKIVNHLVTEMPVRVSALRTLGAYGNVFAIESFMDEMALLAKIDPVAFRLHHLSDPRAKEVIEVAARNAGWSNSSKGRRQGKGIGFAQYKNHAAYVAVVAFVNVDTRTGVVNVERLVAAADAGLIINQDGFKNQIEGGLIQAASWTTREQISFDRNKILTRSWSDYPILRFPDIPKVEVTLIDRPNEASVGVGEAAHGPTAAAIANAVVNAIGKRVRDLPLTTEKILQA
jgi:CO/xanthine dehydrogenase Mo-binding subunit